MLKHKNQIESSTENSIKTQLYFPDEVNTEN